MSEVTRKEFEELKNKVEDTIFWLNCINMNTPELAFMFNNKITENEFVKLDDIMEKYNEELEKSNYQQATVERFEEEVHKAVKRLNHHGDLAKHLAENYSKSKKYEKVYEYFYKIK